MRPQLVTVMVAADNPVAIIPDADHQVLGLEPES
jgi:hypothetical protein